MPATSSSKRISAQAYQALQKALPVVFWYKERTLKPFLKAAFRDHPELLDGLDFKEWTKYKIVDALVDRLLRQEAKYQDATIHLMIEVANMTRFFDLEPLEDSTARIATARRAVAEMKRHTELFEMLLSERERLATQQAVFEQQLATQKKFDQTLVEMKDRFIAMHATANPHSRGKEFEGLLYQLFSLFDLNPSVAYELDTEQIDGAFTHDSDDYIVEARWRREKVSRGQADEFAKKVERRLRITLGLIVSVTGFTKDAVQEYSKSTPFLTMDGTDLMCVLEGRIRLDDMLTRKKRHASETGQCYFSVSDMVI
ncbi:restriction endonuclease [Nocardia brasiliensis]|uniref:restriction endonuclease n=1 Tax=Nocardia brasiliensis TaxID=37326 RepID=UPI002458ABD0|nr:restriction endonuclease [Nocardia brasiliensis]